MKSKVIIVTILVLISCIGGCLGNDEEDGNASDSEENQLMCSLSCDTTQGYVPLSLTFHMSTSDTDNSVSSWSLTLTNGHTQIHNGFGNPPSTYQVTITSPGTFTAKLTVVDSDGTKATDTISNIVAIKEVPNLSFRVSNNKLTVVGTEGGLAWNYFSIKTSNENSKINGVLVGQNWIKATYLGQSGYIMAGDEFIVSNVAGNVIVTIKYEPTNTIIGEWTLDI